MTVDTAPSPGVLAVTTIARPKRVAFLVHPERVTHEEVNAIIEFSSGCWGGRRFPIVPCSGHSIDAGGWALLNAVDPDVIYSLVPLEPELVSQINRRVLPARICDGSENGRHRQQSKPLIDPWAIAALTTAEIPRYWSMHRESAREPVFFWIDTRARSDATHTFVVRNFGTLPHDVPLEAMFLHLPIAAEPLTEFKADQVLDWFAIHTSTQTPVVPLDLAAKYAPPEWDLPADVRTRRFHLAIGNNPWDAIFAWNIGLRDTPGAGRTWLWISAEQSADESFLDKVGSWIAREHWPDPQFRDAAVVSSSLSSEELERIARRLERATQRVFQHLVLKPAELAYSDLYEGCTEGTAIFSRTEGGSAALTEQVPVAENRVLARFRRPPFLTRAEDQRGWMVDALIPYRPERYFYSNVRPHWKLPRRLGLSRLFFRISGVPGSTAHRITGKGLPSRECNARQEAIQLDIPPDGGVLHACCLGLNQADLDRMHPGRASPFSELQTSDAGRYLQGILQTFTSLYHVSRLFDDPFWRRIALDLAGWDASERTSEGRAKRTLEVLQTHCAPFPSAVEVSPEALKGLAAQLADALTFRDRAGLATISLEELKGKFAQLRGEVLRAREPTQYWEALTTFDQTKEWELDIFRQRRVFLQGVDVRCPVCFTTTWHPVDGLRSFMQCAGCASHFPFPLDPPWRFRLNGLLSNAICRHGMLSVLQALCQLDASFRSHDMFLFVPCQNVYRQRPPGSGVDHGGGLDYVAGDLFTDLDLLYIARGRFVLGEVKSTPRGFKPADLEKLKTIALEFLPDDVVLAATGREWPPDIQAQIEQLSAELQACDIRVIPQLMQWPN